MPTSDNLLIVTLCNLISGSKIRSLRGQLEASRCEKERILNEKHEMQITCRATQERLSHSEARVSELVSKNAALEQKIKDMRQLRNKGLRECQEMVSFMSMNSYFNVLPVSLYAC